MKRKIAAVVFTKMVASGNDFVVVEEEAFGGKQVTVPWIKKVCDRKFGIGADGLLWLGKSKAADIRMRIFNADGSEAEMCGNGARCVASYLAFTAKLASSRIETKAGIIEAEVNADKIKIKLTDPARVSLDIPLELNQRVMKVNFINTGVPHTVVFTSGLDDIDVDSIGRNVRYHEYFKPAGTNVDFIEILDENYIKVRTYERGVEAETLACGTGSVASALVFALKAGTAVSKIKVLTRSTEVLTVYFDKKDGSFTNVWLEGKAQRVFEGKWQGAAG